MHRTLTTVVAGLTTAAALACAPAEPATTTEEDVAAIERVREAEVAALKAVDIEGSLAILTEDCRMLPPNEPMLTGVHAAHAWIETFHEQFTADIEYTDAEIIVSGDWAIERYAGRMTATPKVGGDPMTEVIKGIHIYQRQADGSWKIAQDIWNSDAPLGGM